VLLALFFRFVSDIVFLRLKSEAAMCDEYGDHRDGMDTRDPLSGSTVLLEAVTRDNGGKSDENNRRILRWPFRKC
jgi:hypothetical protein